MGWIVEAESRGDGDRMDRTRLWAVLRTRGNDGGLGRRIGTRRRAGGMAEGVRRPPEPGGGPGGGSAPGRATPGLQHGLEAWGEREGRPRRRGRCVRRRCADDCGLGGALAAAARTIMAVVPKRVVRCGLTLPPPQTALVSCRQPGGHQPAARGNGTGDCRGFPHAGTTARQGCWGRKRRTARTRLGRPTQTLWRGGRTTRQAPVKAQDHMRSLQVRGHFQSDGI